MSDKSIEFHIDKLYELVSTLSVRLAILSDAVKNLEARDKFRPNKKRRSSPYDLGSHKKYYGK